LTEGINNIHKEFDINRTQWQILNYIQTNNSIERAKIIEIMEIFDSKENIENTIEKLI
jgi:DNA-binding MarR family transcriptional regulator